MIELPSLLALGWLVLGPPPPEPGARPTLTWSAPAECPSEAELRSQTEALLGQPLDRYERALDVRATVEHATTPEPRWRVRLVLGERVRELDASECATLADAVALIVASTIDPAALDRALADTDPVAEPEPTAEPDPAAEPEPAPAPEPLPAPEPEPAAAPLVPEPPPLRVSGLLRLGGGLLLGPLPGLAGTPTLSVGIDRRALRVALTGGWALSRPARDGDHPEVGVETSLGWVALQACGVPALGPIELPICAGVQAGGIRGRALGIERPGIDTLPWLAFEAGLGVVWTHALGLGPFVEVAALVPVLRPGFALEGAGLLHRAGSVGVRVIAGLEVRIPAMARTSRDGSSRARPRRGR